MSADNILVIVVTKTWNHLKPPIQSIISKTTAKTRTRSSCLRFVAWRDCIMLFHLTCILRVDMAEIKRHWGLRNITFQYITRLDDRVLTWDLKLNTIIFYPIHFCHSLRSSLVGDIPVLKAVLWSNLTSEILCQNALRTWHFNVLTRNITHVIKWRVSGKPEQRTANSRE